MIKTHHRARLCMTSLLAWLLLPAAAFATGGPNFGSVNWQPLGCDNPDLISHSSPGAVDFVGDQANPPASYAYDANYLYFRYRLDSDPGQLRPVRVDGAHAGAVGQPVPVPVPALAERQERQDRDLAQHDGLEHPLPALLGRFGGMLYSAPVGSLARQRWQARAQRRTDFLYFAFPVSTLIAEGRDLERQRSRAVVLLPGDVDHPNSFNKSFLNCPFQPYTKLDDRTRRSSPPWRRRTR